MSDRVRPRIDYTNKDFVSLVDALLELGRERLPEWTDQSANDLGVMLVEQFAYMGDLILYNTDRIAAESYLETAAERRSVLNLLRLVGYELRPPVSASADLTLLFEHTAAGNVTIPNGTTFSTTKETTGKPVTFRYVRPDLTFDRSTLPLYTLEPTGALVPFSGSTPDATTFRLFRTLPVVQVDASVTNEIVASSDGTPGQRFALARSPVVEGSLVVTVDEGGGAMAWTQKDTLLNSQASDPHFAVRRDDKDVVWIEFGDGKYGKTPRRGRNNVGASYLVGGGLKGNVAARTIVKVMAPPIDKIKHVFNEKPATGGQDSEATAQAVLRGPQQFRSMGRAVTAADYELHAKSFGVDKVRATAPGWNRIDLVVAPAGGGVPTDTLKDDLRRYFESKRMLTSLVDISDPQYVEVGIEGQLTVEARYSQKQVRQKVEDAMRALWAFENVDFEDTLYVSKVYEAIEAIDGVAAIVVSKFARTDGTTPADGTLRFGFREIPLVKGILLTAVEGGLTDG